MAKGLLLLSPNASARCTVRAEGSRVLTLDGEGRLLFDMPWQAADALARAYTAKARAAEEHEKAEQIAFDTAILARAGAPFGLTNNPAIKAEAAKFAVSDRNLRRYMPGGVKSKAVLGTPSVHVAPPPKETP